MLFEEPGRRLAHSALPTKAVEVDASLRIELDRFCFQEGMLEGFAAEAGAQADSSLRVDDAVPGDVVLLG